MRNRPAELAMKSHLRPRMGIFHYQGITFLTSISVVLFMMGGFFWTQSRFQFSNNENLLLNVTQGICYIFASRWGGRLSDRLGYDRVLGCASLGLSTTLLLGWIPTLRWTPFILFMIYSTLMGGVWPVLEAAMHHCKGARSLPERMGAYNTIWSGGMFAGFFLCGFLYNFNPDSILWVGGIFHLACWIWLKTAPTDSLPESILPLNVSTGSSHDSEKCRRFMHMAWIANIGAFMMFASFSPLMPSMAIRLGLPPDSTIWLTSILLLSRTLSFVLFWKWEGWHYRSSYHLMGFVLAPIVLGVAFFTSKIPVVFASLLILGITSGLAYTGSLYYSLAYGTNKGEHGGIHESMVGLGILAGPLLGIAGDLISRHPQATEWTVVLFSAILALIGIIKLPLKRTLTLSEEKPTS